MATIQRTFMRARIGAILALVKPRRTVTLRALTMFVADRLIYLQLQKTGCTHIAKLLEQSVGGKQLKKHSRIADPAACAGKTIVGSIRNPWDWYVSLWAFGCAGEGGIHRAVTRRRWLRSFAEEWRETYRDRNDPKLFRQWLRLMMDPRRRRDMGGILSDGPLFAGVYTHRYVWLHWRELTPVHSLEELRQTDASNNLLNAIIHTESLESDLIRVLAQAGYQATLNASSLPARPTRPRIATPVTITMQRPSSWWRKRTGSSSRSTATPSPCRGEAGIASGATSCTSRPSTDQMTHSA